MCKMTELQLAS